MKSPLLLALFATALIASRAHSALLVGTSVEAGESASFQQNQYLAQGFTLTEGVTLMTVQMTFVENPGPEFEGVFQITNQIGVGATPTNVLLSRDVTLPAGTGPASVTVSTPLALVAGNYFLLLSTTTPLPLQTRWARGAPIGGTSGVVGEAFFSVSQNLSLPAASPFAPLDPIQPASLAFQIFGVPEPQGWRVSIMALSVLWVSRRSQW